jgi:hypothetical protein
MIFRKAPSTIRNAPNADDSGAKGIFDAESRPTLKDDRWPEGKKYGALGVMARVAGKVVRRIYRRETYLILSFDLKKRPIPSPKTAEIVTIRLLTPDDVSCFLELWRDQRALKAQRFKRRMEAGYIGIGTWHEGRLVGVNWLATSEDYDPFIGLSIKMSPGSCLALDLQEDEEFKHHRIGLATLAFSMGEARRRGFRYQFIVVNDQNKKMLAGAKYLMGYKQVGEITTTYWFRWAHSRWHFGSRTGRTKTMILGEYS